MALVLASQTDPELVSPPSDSISALSFSPTSDILALASWDNSVRLYETSQQGQSQAKAEYKHEGPVFDVCWSSDGSKVISVGADRAGRCFDLQTGQSSQVAAHDAPIRNCRWVNQANGGGFLATAGWDKTLKYWDLRTPNPVSTVQLPDKVYTMDSQANLLVLGLANKSLQIIDLNNPGTIFRGSDSPLKQQTRVVSCFTNGSGFAVGSIEGRVGIQHMDRAMADKNFSFKCHRLPDPPKTGAPTQVYSVNAMAFHKVHGTFATGGADGRVTFWDHANRSKLKTLEALPVPPGSPANTPATPITSLSFNHNQTLLAAAVSYDWGRGHEGNVPGAMMTKVRLHVVRPEEVMPKPKAR